MEFYQYWNSQYARRLFVLQHKPVSIPYTPGNDITLNRMDQYALEYLYDIFLPNNPEWTILNRGCYRKEKFDPSI